MWDTSGRHLSGNGSREQEKERAGQGGGVRRPAGNLPFRDVLGKEEAEPLYFCHSVNRCGHPEKG